MPTTTKSDPVRVHSVACTDSEWRRFRSHLQQGETVRSLLLRATAGLSIHGAASSPQDRLEAHLALALHAAREMRQGGAE